jgi:hypothetical protein
VTADSGHGSRIRRTPRVPSGRLGRSATALFLLFVIPVVVIPLSGNGHVPDRDKLWVNVLSWVSAVALYLLILCAVIAVWRAWRLSRVRNG